MNFSQQRTEIFYLPVLRIDTQYKIMLVVRNTNRFFLDSLYSFDETKRLTKYRK